ncbi:hypothetical protein BJY14_008778 [Actinomadura luteofluorescens]|uniref:Uncharacterized protein n=1 Tax=Actinomadura luteofluorescens TaxID=46163 RepID=A0A7Y9JKX3_9ACTN|nr:DUF6069 family protein [Actinomadura luteofluorescens]NYD52795.1 hypothetical protein [Actinomadura luteofluorescens]
MSGGTGARRALTVAGAVAAPLALWVVTGPVTGLDPSAETGGEVQPVGAGLVIAGSLIPGLAAWGLLALLERVTGRPGRVWTVIAVAALVLSMSGPLSGAADGASMAVLAGMHLIVAAILIPGLGRTARPTSRRDEPPVPA